MHRARLAALLALTIPAPVLAQDAPADEVALEARLWLDQGAEPVVQRGDRVRIYYRTTADAFVAIFHIDTDGSVSLLHPRTPDEDHWTRGGRDYRLLFPRSPYWLVDEDPGIGYDFIVASPEPFDFSDFEYAAYDRGWELTQVGRTVYSDPYLAIDDFVASLVPEWESVPYALDFITYHVGQTHSYPRFLCYDCHGFRSYTAWNPYAYACSSFRVVIWDDPYYYPAYRYSGTRVVYVNPERNRPRFEVAARAYDDVSTPIVRTRQPPVRRAVDVPVYKEPDAAVAQPSTAGAARPGRPSAGAPATAPSSRPILRYVPPRRTSTQASPNRPAGESPPARSDGARGVVASPPAAGGTTADTPVHRAEPTPTGRPSASLPGATGSAEPDRPVLQRRSTTVPAPSSTAPAGAGRQRPTMVRPPATRGGSSTGATGRAPTTPSVRGILPRSGTPTRTVPARPPTVRSAPATGGRPPTPTVRSRPSGSSSPPAARPPTRPPTGAGPAARPPARRPGGTGTASRRGGRGGGPG